MFDPCLLHYVYFATNLFWFYLRLPLGYIKFKFQDIKQMTDLGCSLEEK